MTLTPSKFFYRAVPILLGLLLLARLIGMAAAPLLDTTEARYGEISRKMAELNDWVTPWFDHGVPYWGKPPLAFWVTAISFKLFGVNEFSARLPHLIISLLIVGLVVWLAARRDRAAAVPTLALISGSFLFFVSSGAVMTDIELILGMTLTMAGFWLALEDIDEVEGSGLARPCSLYLHERRDGVRPSGEQDVLALRSGKGTGGNAVEDEERDQSQEGDRADGAPGCEQAPQNRNRFRPPSTTRVWPVT